MSEQPLNLDFADLGMSPAEVDMAERWVLQAEQMQAEIDGLRRRAELAEAQVQLLVSALERTEANFRSAVRGMPVRDMDENLAENHAALAAASTTEKEPA